MKFLQATMPDGSIWQIPASFIADQRAQYYAAQEGPQVYEEEFNHALRDDDEITDWAANNMNWEDVQAQASRIAEPSPPDYAAEWLEAELEVVDV